MASIQNPSGPSYQLAFLPACLVNNTFVFKATEGKDEAVPSSSHPQQALRTSESMPIMDWASASHAMPRSIPGRSSRLSDFLSRARSKLTKRSLRSKMPWRRGSEDAVDTAADDDDLPDELAFVDSIPEGRCKRDKFGKRPKSWTDHWSRSTVDAANMMSPGRDTGRHASTRERPLSLPAPYRIAQMEDHRARRQVVAHPRPRARQRPVSRAAAKRRKARILAEWQFASTTRVTLTYSRYSHISYRTLGIIHEGEPVQVIPVPLVMVTPPSEVNLWSSASTLSTGSSPL